MNIPQYTGGIFEKISEMRDASDKLKDDDRSNDGRAASTIMKNGVLIIADIWSFIDYLGNTYPCISCKRNK